MAYDSPIPWKREGPLESQKTPAGGSTLRSSERVWWLAGDECQPISWLYRGVLPTIGVCVVSAPSGAGKTFLALHLAYCLAVGADFFGIPAEERGGTLILAAEAYGSIQIRAKALRKPGDPDLPIAATYVGGLASRLAWAELSRDVKKAADEMLLRDGVPVRLIILDTLSASGLLEDENDNAKAALAMRAMADLAIEIGALFVAVHHPPKSGVGERGAGAIRNNADYVMRVERIGHSAIRRITMDKSRDGEERVLGLFTLAPVQVGLDRDGEPIRTMVVSPSSGYADPPLRPSRHAALLHACHADICDLDVYERDGQQMIPHSILRAEFGRRQPEGKHRSNVARDFRNAVSTSRLQVREIEGERFYLSASEGDQPLSSRPPPKVGGLTDNQTARGRDNQKTAPDNLTTPPAADAAISALGLKGVSHGLH